MNVELIIDELVLHGFDPRERWAIADAVRSELQRAIAARGITPLQSSIDIPRLDAGTINLGAARGAAAGPPLAGALHAALAPPDPRR